MNGKLLRNSLGLAGIGGLGALAAGYVFAARPWHLRWGATDEELSEKLPGDEVKSDAGLQITHAITINAPPATVWKWLVQIGQDRGGFYSYDWLENVFDLQIHNSDEIRSEWQKLQVGDFVRGAHKGWLGGIFDDKAGWYVARLDENRALVLRDTFAQGSWSFILKPLENNKTRFVIRARGDKPESAAAKIFQYGFMEPAHFIMERKMLLNLKNLAENHGSENETERETKLEREIAGDLRAMSA